MQKVTLFLISSWILVFSCAQKPSPDAAKMKWISLSAAEAALAKEKRPILIDLYTDWCGWCKVMDKDTYRNNNVVGYLESKFYSVKLDAETREQLSWQGRQYKYDKRNQANELAVYLTRGDLSYPTTVIIPPGGQPFTMSGYLKPGELELFVKYFSDANGYGKTTLQEYEKNFKGSW
jgi:thioredoxin-related protein